MFLLATGVPLSPRVGCEILSTTSPVESKDDINEYHLLSCRLQSMEIPWIFCCRRMTLLLLSSEYYVFTHFAEVEELQPNYTREFKISYADVDWNIQPFSPKYLETETLYNDEPLFGGQLLSIYATHNSNLPPIINADEVYLPKTFSDSEVDQNDCKSNFLSSTYLY